VLVPLILADTHRHQADSNPSMKNSCTKILSDEESLSEAYSTICVTNSSKIEIEALSYLEMGIGKPGFGPYRSGPAAVPAKLLQITVCGGGRTMVQNFIELTSVVFVSLMTLRDKLGSISMGLYRYSFGKAGAFCYVGITHC
jgi:hypothetical protein